MCINITISSVKICVLKDDKKVGSFPISWDGLCVSAAGEGNDEVAVGGADNLVHIYSLSGNTLTEVSKLYYYETDVLKCWQKKTRN